MPFTNHYQRNYRRPWTILPLTEHGRTLHNVCVELDLQAVTTDQQNGASANRQDDTRLEISANGVWGGRFKKTNFDVRVLNPLAPTIHTKTGCMPLLSPCVFSLISVSI